MKNTNARTIAIGGVFAAMAVVVMCMGGMIPVATFVCPMLCMLLLKLVLNICGRRIAWAWYGCVAALALLLGPDKEAAATFLFLGYYPILKPKLDTLPVSWLWKALLFNAAIALMYLALLRLMGMEQIAMEYAALGKALTALMLVLGNVTFFLLDMVLGRKRK